MKAFICLTASVLMMTAPALAFRDGRGAACTSRSDCSSSTDECLPYIDGNRYCVALDVQCAWPGIVGVRAGTRISHETGDYVCAASREWTRSQVVPNPGNRTVASADSVEPSPHRSAEDTVHCTECPHSGAMQPKVTPVEPGVSRGSSIPAVIIRATADAWIRVYDRSGSVILSQILRRGQSWPVPRKLNLLLTTGNAGGTQLVVGHAVIPSLGAANQVRRDIRLDPNVLIANHGG